MYSETVVLAKYHYDKERDLAKFRQYLKEAEHINENGYEVLVLISVKAFVDERDPLKALQYLKRARKVNDGEFTWLYNKAFIYMYLGKFELGYKDYRKLKDITFPGDEAIIDQCLEFNKALIAKEPDKIQCHFILGYLYMNKKCNLPLALEEFDLFINNAKGNRAYDYLVERAVTHKRDIEIKMGL
jgi:tetratricopeptide (TPR) repeat protein